MTMPTSPDVPTDSHGELRQENTELRTDALRRRAEVRQLAESLPTAVSRHAVLRQMLSEVRHHPDKGGVARRAVAKAGRAPRKAARLLRDRT